MWSKRILVLSTISLMACLVAMGGAQTHAKEMSVSDVQGINQWMMNTRDLRGSDQISIVEPFLVPHLLNRVPHGLRGIDERGLRAIFRESLSAHLEPLEKQDVGEARAALAAKTLSVIYTTRWLDNIVARWLGVPLVGQAAVGHRDKKTSAPARVTALTPLISTSNRGSFIALELARSRLLSDVGGVGSGNGVIEKGEWISLEFVFKNTSPRALFSTSAFVKTGVCVWTAREDRETVLAEMLRTGETSIIRLEAYLAPACATPSGYDVDLVVRDTHRSDATNLSVRLQPSSLPASPKLHNIQFDTDIPGYSKGDSVGVLRPGLRFELSTGLQLDPQKVTSQASLAWGLSAWSSDIVHLDGYQSASQQASASGVFVPTDDLDIEVAGARQLKSVRRSHTFRRLQPADKSFVLLAADVRFSTENNSNKRPDPPPPRAPNPTIVTAETALGLLKSNIRFVPREETPREPHSMGAVAGYDVVVNRSNFLKEWNRLEASGEASGEVSFVARNSQTYLSRLYLRLPMQTLAKPKRPKRPVKRPRKRPRKRRVQKVAVRKALPPRKSIRLDLGFGVSEATQQTDRSPFTLWPDSDGKSHVLPAGSIRLSYGQHLATVVELHAANGAIPLGVGDVSLWDTKLGLGVSYRFYLGASLEFQPRLLLGVAVRAIPGSFELTPDSGSTFEGQNLSFEHRIEPQVDLMASIGLNLRLRLSDRVGLFADASFYWSADSPTMTIEVSDKFGGTFQESLTEVLFEGGSSAFKAGLSFLF